MSVCSRCGSQFGCAMADGLDAPCWCTALPPVVPVPRGEAGEIDASASCWCPDCLRKHIAASAHPPPPGT